MFGFYRPDLKKWWADVLAYRVNLREWPQDPYGGHTRWDLALMELTMYEDPPVRPTRLRVALRVCYNSTLGAWRSSLLGMALLSLLCEVRGHAIESDGWCTPDTGGESLDCTRCGWSHTITYY